MRSSDVGSPITTIPIPLQAYGITSITTMYLYLHQQNYLRSKVKLILSINGHKQLLKLHFLDRFVSAFMEWNCGVVILHVLLIGYDHVILSA